MAADEAAGYVEQLGGNVLHINADVQNAVEMAVALAESCEYDVLLFAGLAIIAIAALRYFKLSYKAMLGIATLMTISAPYPNFS